MAIIKINLNYIKIIDIFLCYNLDFQYNNLLMKISINYIL